MGDSGVRERRVELVKGRMRRLRKVGIVKAIRRVRRAKRRTCLVRDGRLGGFVLSFVWRLG